MPDFPRIPGYRIERELGQGGMARVYLAFEEKLERRVALKVLLPGLSDNHLLTERFIREAKLAARLNHPNIIHILDVGQAGAFFYFTMELVQQPNLKETILGRAGRGLEPQAALAVARQVASALDYAHKSGIVHRDIKPENILFHGDGTPVIADFGIARAMDSNTRLTDLGMSIGSPHYMSPEQARGEKLDGRTDLYSLGVVLYEMLTGCLPYQAENTVGVVIKHIQEPIPQLPPELVGYQSLIYRTMAKNRDDRVADAAELVQLLDSQLAGKSAAAPLPGVATVTTAAGIQEEKNDTIPQDLRLDRDKSNLFFGLLLIALGLSILFSTTRILPFSILMRNWFFLFLVSVGLFIHFKDLQIRRGSHLPNKRSKYRPGKNIGHEVLVFIGYFFLATGIIVLLDNFGLVLFYPIEFGILFLTFLFFGIRLIYLYAKSKV